MRDRLTGWAAAYRTPVWLGGVFVVLLALFAVTPDPAGGGRDSAQPTSEPTPDPRECVVCPIDQRCDPGSGRCVFVEHTPLPCVRSANFDEEAGFCLPEGAPPPPPPVATAEPADGRVPGPAFPPGIRDPRDRRTPRPPAIGNRR